MATEHTTAGKSSLAELAKQHNCPPSTIIRLTAESSPQRIFPPNVADYINGVFHGKISPGDPMPAGLRLYLP